MADITLNLDSEFKRALYVYFFSRLEDTPDLRKIFEDGYSQGAKDAIQKIGEMIEEWTKLDR